MDVQKNNEIYRNKLQSDLLSLSEYLAAAYCNTGTNSAASGRIVMDFVQTFMMTNPNDFDIHNHFNNFGENFDETQHSQSLKQKCSAATWNPSEGFL